MAGSTTFLDTIAESDSSKAEKANALFDAASPAMQFARRDSTTIALTWGYFGGQIGGTTIASGTLTLTASRVSFLVVHKTTGAVSASIDAANWCTPKTYARLYKVTCGAIAISSWEDHRFGKGGVWGDLFGAASGYGPFVLPVTVGDISTAITTGTSKEVVIMPFRGLIDDIVGSLGTASSSGAPAFDFNDGGVSILGTTLTFDANETDTSTAATPAVLATEAGVVAEYARISVDVDTAGTGAKGPRFWIRGQKGWGDPAFDLVGSALTLEGTNGGTTWTDAVSGVTWSAGSSVATSTAQSVNGTFAGYAASSTYFGTSNQYLRSTALAAFDCTTAPWCLQFWVRAASVANTPLLATIGSATNNRLNLYANSGALTLYTETASGGGANRINGGSLSINTWYFVELSYDLTTFKLWLDGVSQGTSTTTVVPAGTLQIDLGNYAYSPSATNVLDGYMQRWRYTRNLVRRTAAYSRPPKPWAAY